MARPAKPQVIEPEVLINQQAFDQAASSLNELAVLNTQAHENAYALANEFGYEGTLSVGSLEDEIRFYKRRTAESLLELGKRLLLLKELTPHGEFSNRVELLGFHERAARRFMQAALKFSKSDNLSDLAIKIESQSKLIELVTMDDDDLEQLANGETVHGLKLDDIESMTASQLKMALREARENEEATARILADKNSAMDKMATQLTAQEQRTKTKSPDEVAKQLRNELMMFGFEAEHAIANRFIPAAQALIEHAHMHGGDESGYIHGLLLQIEQCCSMVRQQFPAVDKQLLTIDLSEPLNSEQATQQASAQTAEISAKDLLQ